MFGALKTAIGLAKHIKPIAGTIKNVVVATKDSKDEIAELFKSFKEKLDTDGDGQTDFTKKEALEFIGEVVVVVAKRL